MSTTTVVSLALLDTEDKMGLERHLGDRARKMVKERCDGSTSLIGTPWGYLVQEDGQGVYYLTNILFDAFVEP